MFNAWPQSDGTLDGRQTQCDRPRANGMCFEPGGDLIACADEKNELWSIAPGGTVRRPPAADARGR